MDNTLKKFVPPRQITFIKSSANGEEGDYFNEIMDKLTVTFNSMPKSYEQDGMGDKAIAYLHYFISGSDWYITEQDTGDQQLQAFGFAVLNGDTYNAGLGYISIEGLKSIGVELDLHFTPITLAEIKQQHGITGE